jgi:hypothetical protein
VVAELVGVGGGGFLVRLRLRVLPRTDPFLLEVSPHPAFRFRFLHRLALGLLAERPNFREPPVDFACKLLPRPLNGEADSLEVEVDGGVD